MTYASAVKRISAFLIDLLILAAFVVGTQIVIEPLVGIHLFKGDHPGPLVLGFVLLTVSLPTWLYFIFFESSRLQATPGKLLLGLLVTDDDGHRLKRRRVVLRTFIKMFPFEAAYATFLLPTPMFSDAGRGEFRISAVMIAGMVMVYLLMMCWNDAHQSMHDLIAESCVIDKHNRSWLPWRKGPRRPVI